MDKPVSFDVNHSNLKSGVYVSRVDHVGDTRLVTLDIRLFSRDDIQSGQGFLNIKPNWFEGSFSAYVAGLHSLEHTLATLLRTETDRFFDGCYDVVYIGPGGCLSMFYLVLAEKHDEASIEQCKKTVVAKIFKAVLEYLEENDVPATGAAQCGNPTLHSKLAAKVIATHYLSEFDSWEEYYPEAE